METCTAERLLIRRAESTDIDAIIDLGWRNVADEKYKSKLVYDQRRMRMYVGVVLADDRARWLVAEENGEIVGTFAFTTFPNYYVFGGQKVANLIIWSVSPKCRGKVSIVLLRAAEKEARELEAKRMLLTGPGQNFGKLVSRLGYEYFESTFLRSLE